MAYLLTADVGGTKTDVALCGLQDDGSLSIVREVAYPSRKYTNLEAILLEFLALGPERPDACTFGIAGPVVGEVVLMPNLGWRVEAASVARAIGCERVHLMNDLETTAYGALFLRDDEIMVLNKGVERTGNCAVIAAGTGLGQAFLLWDGTRHLPIATEGGHADFAPRNDEEIELLRFLRARLGRVSYERVLSGPGLVNIFRYLDEHLKRPIAPAVRERLAHEDHAAVIGQAGVAATCGTCREAVEMFATLYGAQAGNLALSTNSIGGVFIGGGIVTKIVPILETGGFMRAFSHKGRYETFLEEMPVRVILNAKTALLGAGHAAAELLKARERGPS